MPWKLVSFLHSLWHPSLLGKVNEHYFPFFFIIIFFNSHKRQQEPNVAFLWVWILNNLQSWTICNLDKKCESLYGVQPSEQAALFKFSHLLLKLLAIKRTKLLKIYILSYVPILHGPNNSIFSHELFALMVNQFIFQSCQNFFRILKVFYWIDFYKSQPLFLN